MRSLVAVTALVPLLLLAGCFRKTITCSFGEGPPPEVAEAHAAAPDAPPPVPTPLADTYRATAARILEAARSQDVAHARLRHLCDVIGSRFSGTPGLDAAVAWTAETMAADGLDVRKEPVLVPAWIRGRESAVVTAPVARDLAMLGLGNSVGTPPEGIEADVVPVRDFDHLTALGDAVRGKIVLYTAAMPAYDASSGAGYGQTVVYRTQGPSRAAKQGAVAVLVRSVTATSLRTPHTGTLTYALDAPRIPAAAVSVEDATWIARRVEDGAPVRVRLTMEARFGEDVPSANVVGEIRGAERPDEIVLLGAHLDSWDVGQGAHDDGANCIALMEALRTIRRLGLRPRRTIRAVLFVNEENGLRGAIAYAAKARETLPKHVAAIEADSGCYAPLGFTSPAPKDARGVAFRERMRDVMTLLAPLGAGRLRDGGSGADIGLLEPSGVPLFGLEVEGSRYFDVHHTHADTFEKVEKHDLDGVAAVLAVTAFVLADAP